MLLKRIELENVKTHKKTIIPFKKGLNVFHGDNGTGKSTVLEMIGFILFDHLEGRAHSDYVRDISNDKQEFGKVKLWIIGLNNEQYILERSIGKSEIAVYHGLSNRKLAKIEKIAQLKSWIENQIGLSGGIELDKLFKTSIGIPQGTFINPFQRDPRGRTNYFDPILNLRIYEEIWKGLGKLKKGIYDNQLHKLKENISELGGKLINKPRLAKKIEDLKQKIDDLKAEMEEVKKRGKRIKERLDELNSLNKEIKLSQEKQEKLKIREENAKNSVDELLNNLNQAKKAQKICEKTKSNYEQYELQTQQQKKLQESLTALQEKQIQLQDLNKNKLKIENDLENIENQINDAKEACSISKKLEKKYKRYKELEVMLSKITEALSRYKTLKESLLKKEEYIKILDDQVEEFNKKKGTIVQLEKDFKKLGKLESNLEKKKSEILNSTKEISLIKENHECLLAGKCPFFNQSCKNIEEKQADPNSLLLELEDKKLRLRETKDIVNKLEKDLEVRNEIQNKIQKFGEERIRIKEIQRQANALNAEIQNERQTLSEASGLDSKRSKLESEKEKLESIINEYITSTELSKKLPDLEKKTEPLSLDLNKRKEEIKKLETDVNKLRRIPNLLKEIQESLTILKLDHTEYQKNIKKAEEVSKIESDWNKNKSKLKTIMQDLQTVESTLNNLQSKYDETERKQYEDEYNKYEKKKTELETQINEKQANFNENKKDFINLEELESDLSELNEEKQNLEVQQLYIEKLRIWIREFIPKMRGALINKINITASEIYRNIREEDDAVLKWLDDYDVEVSTSKSIKNFFRLSGGEKMSAALAIRLAILKVLTNANFAFFDEPTTNLDESTRKNLSKYIYNIKGFEQLFVISHDNSFKRHSEYVVRFTKDENEITHIDYVTKAENP